MKTMNGRILLLLGGGLAALLLAPVRAAGATTYEVGPGKFYASVGAVPWESLVAGDTVLIYWRATPYQEKWVICRQGTALAPITVRGVPDAGGQLPVISGSGATTRPQLSYWGHNRGVIKIGGASVPADTVPKYIVIENLDIRDGRQPYTYTYGGATNTYQTFAAAIYIEKGENITIRNCKIHECGNGLFASSNDTVATRNLLIEGNDISDNGNSLFEHNSYLAAIGVIYQYNRCGPLRSGCTGNNLKDRSAGLVVRYNWISGGSRQLDLVDGSDSALIRADPSYRQTHVYGNVLIKPTNEGNNQFIQYGGDQGDPTKYRKGTLSCYHNTFVSKRTGGLGNTVATKLVTNDERCDFRNNIVYTVGNLALLEKFGVMDLTHNWLRTGWRTSFEVFGGTLNNDGTSLTGTVPGFMDYAGEDFRIEAGSRCVDSATALPPGAPAVDREYVKHQTGRARPVVGAIDIGAFENEGGALPSDGNVYSGPGGSLVDGVPGAYYTELGVPAINDLGQLAYAAKIWTGLTTDDVIMVGASPALLARDGDAAPGGGGAVFRAFGDPLLNQSGAVAFTGKISGAGVAASNDDGIWCNAFGGGLTLVAREGSAATDAGGATWSTFRSVALEQAAGATPCVAFDAKLTGAGVTLSNDCGLWSFDGTTRRLLLREGMGVTVNGTAKTLKTFAVLKAAPFAQGQGFGLSAGVISALLTFTDRSTAVASVFADGSALEIVAAKDDAAPGYSPGALIKSLKVPGQNPDGEATFIAGIAGVQPTIASAIYTVTGAGAVERVAAKGDAAAGLPLGATYLAFATAVGGGGGRVGFLGKAAGGGVGATNDSAVWTWDGGVTGLLAREGAAAAGCGTATWFCFKSLAVPDTGLPVFLATLALGSGSPAVIGTTDLGLWAVDSGGTVQLVVREGVTSAGGRTVKSFKVLGLVGGSPAQARSHNGVRGIVYWALFGDGTRGIIKAQVP